MLETLNNFYRGKRVLVTGHTGFKGSWLCIFLKELGAEVIGYGLDPAGEKDNFVLAGLERKVVDIRGDIRDPEHLAKVFCEYRPEMVFHLAAQPLVRYSYEKPVETYMTNVMGTIHVMEAFRHCESARVGVFITTDKCYENKEQLWGYRETDPMGGYDPYSSSKGACELAISSWRRSFMNPENFTEHGKAIASARAGNVIGGGDWAKDRIIPDCIRALEAGHRIPIRNPKAVRPWQHVLEPLRGYLMLGKALWEDPVRYAEGWNFGPEYSSVLTVDEVVKRLIREYGRGEVEYLKQDHAPHEANLLMLDITKAYRELCWKPVLNIDQCMHLVADWYRRYAEEDVYNLCCEQLSSYCQRSSL